MVALVVDLDRSSSLMVMLFDVWAWLGFSVGIWWFLDRGSTEAK